MRKQNDSISGSSVSNSSEFDSVVSFGGRNYCAKEELARIFLKNAQRVVDRGGHELVPLAHRDGVELLAIGPHAAFSVFFCEENSADASADAELSAQADSSISGR
jgi:hypothetical protein